MGISVKPDSHPIAYLTYSDIPSYETIVMSLLPSFAKFSKVGRKHDLVRCQYDGPLLWILWVNLTLQEMQSWHVINQLQRNTIFTFYIISVSRPPDFFLFLLHKWMLYATHIPIYMFRRMYWWHINLSTWLFPCTIQRVVIVFCRKCMNREDSRTR